MRLPRAARWLDGCHCQGKAVTDVCGGGCPVAGEYGKLSEAGVGISKMKVTVKPFPSVQQILGRSVLEIELDPGATVSDLQSRLQTQYPQLHLDSGGMLLAVNLRYAKADRRLSDGDEIALLWAVGGG